VRGHAGRRPTLAGEKIWDHGKCDHSERFFSERASVRRVPDGALQVMVRTFESLRIGLADAGNSDAPASSSASSEPSSAVEDQSSPSFQDETPDAVPTT
jgi:hypothetical protein